MTLDARKYQILQAIIDDYIMTAMPVGSRTISRKSGVGFSPATIRNEMSDLEELGYLDQPHTSAGRIPSTKAYRLYVDHLMKVGQISDAEAQMINTHMKTRSAQVEQVIRRAARVLSDATNYASVLVAPQASTLEIRRVQLVPVSENTALMIVVTSAGIVKDEFIRVPDGLTADHLYRISQMLTEQLANQPLSEVRTIFAQMFRDLGSNRRLLGGILQALEDKLEENTGDDVVVGGAANLLNLPEYSDVEKARNFLSVLETKEKLVKLLRRSGGVEITINIGDENEIPEMKDCSLITASYKVGDGSGTLGIIGPTRMDYGRVVTIMNYMGRVISNILSGE